MYNLLYPILLILVFFNPVFATDNYSNTNYLESEPEHQNLESNPLDTFPDLSFKRFQNPDFYDYWDFPEHYSNNQVIYEYEYEGIYKAIENGVRKGLLKWYNSELQNLWDNSNLDFLELQSRINQYNRIAQFDNNFWETRNNFWDYYPSNKGGQRIETIQLGSHHEFIRFKDISISNTGNISINGGWGFSISQDNDQNEGELYELRDSRQRNSNTPIGSKSRQLIDENRIALGIKTPISGNMYVGDGWVLDSHCKINVKFSETLKSNRSFIRFDLKLYIYGNSYHNWIKVRLRTIAKPFVEEFSFQMSVILWEF